MKTNHQRRLLLLPNWCDRKICLLARLVIAFCVLVSLAMPLASVAGSSEALKAYQSGEYQKALEMWLLLAYEGDAEAQYRLGLMFLHGSSVGVSAEEAVYWLSRAAEQGESNAQYLLGAIYLSGKELSSDRDHGLEWWRTSARNGNSAAQYGIGIAYLYGAGVSTNFVEAKKWLTAALKGGSPEAGLVLQNIVELSESKSRIDSVSQYARVGSVAVWVYDAFNRLSVILAEANAGELVRIIERQDDWYLVELSQSLTGWINLNDVRQVSGQNVKVADGAALYSEPPSVQEDASVVMKLNKNQTLVFVDLAESWVKLAVPGSLIGWTPVLGLVEQADSHASLQQIWQEEYQSKSRDNHRDGDVATLSEFIRAQNSDDAVSTTEPATTLNVVSLTNQSSGQSSELAESESADSVQLKRNDYEWLLAQAPERYTLELFSSTSEILIREFYRAESFDDYASYFSNSVSDKRWFTLFHGSYNDLSSVEQALSRLPVRLETMRVRRISSVVRDLCSGLDDLPVSLFENLKTRCTEKM